MEYNSKESAGAVVRYCKKKNTIEQNHNIKTG